jgi:lipopolysaccharide/colanic/teichoic acid biosynthesis glycosyltransferase
MTIDKLPRPFNALSGNLSLAGSRPHPLPVRTGAACHDFVSTYRVRRRVSLGIAEWAQINESQGIWTRLTRRTAVRFRILVTRKAVHY